MPVSPDLRLLLLRLMIGVVFVSSGWADLKDPEARSKSIGLSRGLTVLLGIAEPACGLGVAFGVLTQLAAIGLILIMLGAIHRKIFVWHTGFWGEKSSGWHYDLIFIVMNRYRWWTLGDLEMRSLNGIFRVLGALHN